MDFTIKDEFKNLISSPTKDEKELLEAMLLKDGVLDSLKVWKEKNILIDGHTRLEICNKHNLPYKVEYLSFPDEDHVIAWMIKNQSARRNLTEAQKTYLLGKLYEMEKKIHGGNRGNQYTESNKVPSLQNEDLAKYQETQPKPKSTAEKIAREAGVGKSTVERAEQFSNAVDTLTETVSPEIKEEILTGKVKISKSKLQDIALISQSEPEEAKKQYQEAKMGKNKAHKRGRPKKQAEESNVVQITPNTEPEIETILEGIEPPAREIKFTCPICNWVEDGTYIFAGVPYKHPQSFMKELKDAKPATEALHISHSSISRMKAIMPDDPDRILAYEEVIAWCQSAIEDAKQYQLKKQRRR